MVEQPAREHVAQLVADVFAGLEAQAVFADPFAEYRVHALVRLAEGIARFLHQFFFEGEVRERVIDQFVDHLRHCQLLQTGLRNMQLIDHVHNAPVLMIDHLDPGVEVVLPDQQCHRSPLPNAMGIR